MSDRELRAEIEQLSHELGVERAKLSADELGGRRAELEREVQQLMARSVELRAQVSRAKDELSRSRRATESAQQRLPALRGAIADRAPLGSSLGEGNLVTMAFVAIGFLLLACLGLSRIL